MASFEDLFNSSVLQVFAPGSALEFPEGVSGERTKDWLSCLYAEPTDRKVAFFDEIINFLLIIRFPYAQDESEATPEPRPPISLLSFLAHLQISYEASYISPFTSVPSTSSGAVPEIGRPPPRTTSINKDKPVSLLAAAHPTIFPPATPNPVPSAAKSDQQYVQSQGTQLTTGVWGEHHMGPTRETSEAFSLLWAEDEHEWVAVYRMSVLVRYMATKFEDPLLSLTVSTTLREKPLPVTPPRQSIAALLEEFGGSSNPLDVMSPIKSAAGDAPNNGEQNDDDDLLSGLEEINLLEGLQADPTFAASEDAPLKLPSTRLGPKTRRTAFALPPLSGSSSSSQQSRASLTASAAAKTKLPPPPASSTFRKSFRKTMKVVSGFHVRMRTVFVPYFLLPRNGQKKRKAIGTTDEEDEDDVESREQREAGNEEHTVVLSVEIENIFPDIPVPTVPNYSFEVQRADVTVSGTGAKTVLVAWGDAADVFPVRIGPNEQVNLLYAVSFLRAPEVDEMAMAPGTGGQAGKRTSVASAAAAAQEMRRSVSINISVRPFDQPSAPGNAGAVDTGPVSYPTRTYASYWSCKLNFSSATNTTGGRMGEDGLELTALPTPASPFPNIQARIPTIVTNSASSSRPQSLPISSVAGSRKFTYSALDSPAPDRRAKAKSPVNYQGPTAMLNPANQPQSAAIPLTADPRNLNSIITGTSPGAGNRGSILPPSLAFQSSYPRSPTTYASPQDSYFSFASLGQGQGASQFDVTGAEEPGTPRTPAYPAYPGSPPPVPPTPFWQAPLAQQTGAGAVGPTIDMRRDRGGVGSVLTPGLTIPGFPSNVEVSAEVENKAEAGGQPIVVSVGLFPAVKEGSAEGKGRSSGDIYPLDQFTLDIFVFNQSSWTRRFEVSHPDERRRRRKGRGDGKKADGGSPGIMPLENRVRIGPLLPSTCQSVRMDFLALTPGVHPIDELVLTDVQSGFSMHLRSVMDVVVCEP
ncbi:TRAPP trafficking subunit Trs65-domain-containing protein [Rhodofomes roseus]|uniref:TRAPP trafficking subunit Trs65-domain-containing protein n=1 Tax=Rhodofomes roseus TaxID=34475 RepID=A0ABQ8KLV0_9APHY|nr:TRAPP trafficking subunit Trs65-domain-containing protein [Rhodofomes roseus]KAH9839023.1 TRAPP trafficking subunit Trs65-domain-containing protein [Rhodofomes roseus]